MRNTSYYYIVQLLAKFYDAQSLILVCPVLVLTVVAAPATCHEVVSVPDVCFLEWLVRIETSHEVPWHLKRWKSSFQDHLRFALPIFVQLDDRPPACTGRIF